MKFGIFKVNGNFLSYTCIYVSRTEIKFWIDVCTRRISRRLISLSLSLSSLAAGLSIRDELRGRTARIWRIVIVSVGVAGISREWRRNWSPWKLQTRDFKVLSTLFSRLARLVVAPTVVDIIVRLKLIACRGSCRLICEQLCSRISPIDSGIKRY